MLNSSYWSSKMRVAFILWASILLILPLGIMASPIGPPIKVCKQKRCPPGTIVDRINCVCVKDSMFFKYKSYH